MAGRLHDRLAQTFGRDKLFMDVDHIPAGTDFVAHLNSQVAECDVVLVVIGPNWLGVKDESGGRRLDNPDDFVAIEIAAALARDIRVIPVLVDGARMPKASELPDSLKPLARAASRCATIRWSNGHALGNRSPIHNRQRSREIQYARTRLPRGQHPSSLCGMNHPAEGCRQQTTFGRRDGKLRGPSSGPHYNKRRADTVDCSVFAPPAVPPNERP
jgi:hypothetical protein